MKVAKVMLPAAMENCYMAINEDTKECIIIDPGSAAERVKSAVAQTGAKPVAVLLTHGHFDHAGEAATILLICTEVVKHTEQTSFLRMMRK